MNAAHLQFIKNRRYRSLWNSSWTYTVWSATLEKIFRSPEICLFVNRETEDKFKTVNILVGTQLALIHNQLTIDIQLYC